MSYAHLHHHCRRHSSSRLWILTPEFLCPLFRLWWLKVPSISSSSSFPVLIRNNFFFFFYGLGLISSSVPVFGWGCDDQRQCGKWIWVQMKRWKQVLTRNDQESPIVLITSELVFVDLAPLVVSTILLIVNWYVLVSDFWVQRSVWSDPKLEAFFWESVFGISLIGYSHCKDERRIPWKDWSAWMRGELFNTLSSVA